MCHERSGFRRFSSQSMDNCWVPCQSGMSVPDRSITHEADCLTSKIAVGVASYGHSFHVDKSNALASNGSLELYPKFDASQQPAGDSDNTTTTTTQATDICGNPAGGVSGIFNFWGLIDGGFLTENGTAAQGIDYIFDDCSQTVSCSLLYGVSCSADSPLSPMCTTQHPK